MVITFGAVQVTVQRRILDHSQVAAREARRQDLERRVEWDRQKALIQYQHSSGTASL